MAAAVAEGTVKNFRLAQGNFIEFDTLVLRSRNEQGCYSVPTASELILFVTWLATRRALSPSVVKQRLWGVAQWCMQQGASDPRVDTSGNTWAGLDLCLRGIARTRSTVLRIREALTTDKLRRFVHHLPRSGLSQFDQLCYAALLLVGVFALCRVGELCSERVAAFDADTVLRACDVQLGRDDHGDDFVDIVVRASKTDPCRRGVVLRIYATGDPRLCPVTAVRAYLRARAGAGYHHSHPAFIEESGKLVTRDKVQRVIRRLAEGAGYDPTHFVTHSMRAGGATSMAMLGYDASTIQLFGRWRSDCFIQYIRISATARKGVAAQMAALEEIDAAQRRRLWLRFRSGT